MEICFKDRYIWRASAFQSYALTSFNSVSSFLSSSRSACCHICIAELTRLNELVLAHEASIRSMETLIAQLSCTTIDAVTVDLTDTLRNSADSQQPDTLSKIALPSNKKLRYRACPKADCCQSPIAMPRKSYSAALSDRVDALVAAELNKRPRKFYPTRINQGFYKFGCVEFDVAEVNGKLLARTKSWNNEKFGSFSKFLTYIQY